ncbi:hypothetical protein OR37_02165 [Caulobacter vibrioides OR37]|jgi:PAT family beta-lactamase induction signal transducer AmpG|uniref:Major facilitator superfamily (MFS) profile domain-containing protein n=3 Tax=Caulobacter TaxID=75 RepID=R0D0A6_CAUVI|nr:hypothetical protein OR37_02165 [Caulobacter vibrioides OR37]
MTARMEAAATELGAPAPGAATVHPWIFLPLMTPFGVSNGYATVTLAFLLGRAGVSTVQVTAIMAVWFWVQTWKVAWAPLIDTVGDPRRWYGLGALLVGLSIIAMSLVRPTPGAATLLTGLVALSSAAATLVAMSSDVFLTHFAPPTMRGRASGWAQAGNVGGSGAGGGLALLLVQHAGPPPVAALALAAICAACALVAWRLPALAIAREALHYLRRLHAVVVDVWTVARSRTGYLALVTMLLPIASGAAPWPAIAGEWRADADLVALSNGVIGGLCAAVGSLLGGRICDRLTPKSAYATFGLASGVVAVVMAFSPRTQTAFLVFTLAYSTMIGAGFAAYSATVLEAIGRRSAATNFNLMGAISNVPIAMMTTFDGWMHDRFGTRAMLFGELWVQVLAVLFIAGLSFATASRASFKRGIDLADTTSP